MSSKLIKLGGKAITKECKSHPVLQTSQFRVTKGGKTQFQHIVHFVTPTIDLLAEKLEEMLLMVDGELKSKSIAIPAIGTGNTLSGGVIRIL